MKIAVQNRKDAFEIERKWLNSFAGHPKGESGKFRVGRFKWENFQRRSANAKFGTKGRVVLSQQDREDYYLFNEEVSECWECIDEDFLIKPPYSGNWYLLPKSLSWTYIFTHHGEEIFVSNET